MESFDYGNSAHPKKIDKIDWNEFKALAKYDWDNEAFVLSQLRAALPKAAYPKAGHLRVACDIIEAIFDKIHDEMKTDEFFVRCLSTNYLSSNKIPKRILLEPSALSALTSPVLTWRTLSSLFDDPSIFKKTFFKRFGHDESLKSYMEFASSEAADNLSVIQSDWEKSFIAAISKEAWESPELLDLAKQCKIPTNVLELAPRKTWLSNPTLMVELISTACRLQKTIFSSSVAGLCLNETIISLAARKLSPNDEILVEHLGKQRKTTSLGKDTADEIMKKWPKIYLEIKHLLPNDDSYFVSFLKTEDAAYSISHNSPQGFRKTAFDFFSSLDKEKQIEIVSDNPLLFYLLQFFNGSDRLKKSEWLNQDVAWLKDPDFYKVLGELFSSVSIPENVVEILKNDPESCERLVRTHPANYSVLPEEARTKRLSSIALSLDHSLSDHVPKKLLYDRSFLIESISTNSKLAKIVPNGFFQDEKFVRMLLSEIDSGCASVEALNEHPQMAAWPKR